MKVLKDNIQGFSNIFPLKKSHTFTKHPFFSQEYPSSPGDMKRFPTWTRTEARAKGRTIWTDNTPAGVQGTMDIHNKEAALVSHKIWSFVLALSTMLDGYPPQPSHLLKSSLLDRSRTFEELGSKLLMLSELPAS